MVSPGSDPRSTKVIFWTLSGTSICAPLFWGSVDPFAYYLLYGFCFFPLIFTSDLGLCYSRLPILLRGGTALLFTYLVFQSFFLSQNRYESIFHCVRWAAVFAVFLQIQKLQVRQAFTLIVIIAVIGCIESLYVICQHFLTTESALWRLKAVHLENATGTYLNRNHLACLLQMSLGAQVGISLSYQRKGKMGSALVVFIGIAVTLTGLYLTKSRMGTAGGLIILMCFFGLAASRKRWSSKMMAGGSGAALFIFFFAATKVIQERSSEVHAAHLFSDGGRIQVWRGTLEMIHDYLWTGVGLGSYAWVNPMYQPETLFSGWYYAHNDYLQLLAELGLPIFILFMFMLGYFLKLVIIRTSAIRNTDQYPYLLGGSLGIGGYLLHGLTDFNWAIPANHFVAVLLFSISWRLAFAGRSQTANIEGLS